VSVFDFGRMDDGGLFIAMELLRGQSLRAVLRRDGAFDVSRVIWIGIQICDALHAAHALQIVHRDLKLDNVVVLDDPPGRDLLKVLDFGLAKQRDDLMNTAAGIVVGSPQYMAPEVAMAEDALPPADMYGLGVILAELATASSLWGDGGLRTLQIPKLDPGPAIAGVDRRLQPVIKRLLSPEPRSRPTAERARELLQRILGAEVAALPVNVSAANVTMPDRPRARLARPPDKPAATDLPTPQPPVSRARRAMHWLERRPRAVIATIVAINALSLIWMRSSSTTTESSPPVKPRTPTAPMVSTVGCPADFAALPNYSSRSRYKLYNYAAEPDRDARQGFVDAVKTCASQNARVAYVDDAAEALALAAALRLEPQLPRYFVGVTDALSEGEWLTLGGAPAPYLPWADNQPNGADVKHDADCALLDPAGNLYDYYCDRAHPFSFACECSP
jgi:serine/threonine protein kinase